MQQHSFSSGPKLINETHHRTGVAARQLQLPPELPSRATQDRAYDVHRRLSEQVDEVSAAGSQIYVSAGQAGHRSIALTASPTFSSVIMRFIAARPTRDHTPHTALSVCSNQPPLVVEPSGLPSEPVLPRPPLLTRSRPFWSILAWSTSTP